MKTIAIALGLALISLPSLFVRAEDKPEAPKLDGKYTLVSGKKFGNPIDDDAKKAGFTFAPDKVTIEGRGEKFVIGFKIDPKTTPMNIDMEILEGPEDAKGMKAEGIIEVKGDVVKLAYSLEKDKRPKNFEGKEGNTFELKKAK